MKTPDQIAAQAERDERERRQMVSDTKRLFTDNRADNLTRRIRHLREHGWHEQANALADDLRAWKQA